MDLPRLEKFKFLGLILAKLWPWGSIFTRFHPVIFIIAKDTNHAEHE